jgi:hypothetical protein
MILLPVVGLAAGLLVARPWAYAVTAGLAIVGFTLVALTTDEISGAADLFVWGDSAVALGATWGGIWGGKRLRARRSRKAAP